MDDKEKHEIHEELVEELVEEVVEEIHEEPVVNRPAGRRVMEKGRWRWVD